MTLTTPFITIFTAPKPFIDPHIATIQLNAIRSWQHLGDVVEVLLVGEEPGLASLAQELGLRQLTQVRRNASGTPLVSSIFELARAASQAPLLAYVNADILLLPDFLQAARQVWQQAHNFLMIGQRWDLEVHALLEFTPGWEARLKAEVKSRGRLHLPAGSDFFLFPRLLFSHIPDFAIGRAGWDNWMIYHARQQGWLVIDATPSVMVIHQAHDYSHLPGGKPHYELPESHYNQDLAGGSANLYIVLDSDKQLIRGRIRPPRFTFLRLLRRAEVWLTPATGERQGARWWLARRLRRLRRRLTGSL